MNTTAYRANFSRMSHAEQRELEHFVIPGLDDMISQWIGIKMERPSTVSTVSNNLGVYFLFCLFGLAILALFLCRSM